METDLSEVLQTDRIFTNVSKGQFASSKDLQDAFGTTDQVKLCKLLLDKGEIQVTDVERASLLDNTSREVAAMVVDKCIDATTHRPFTLLQIRDAMKKAEFVVQPTSTRSVKQQFLDCVKALQNSKVLNIQRANMELAIIVFFSSDSTLQSLLDALQREFHATYINISQIKTHQTRIQFQIQPHLYKTLERLVRSYQNQDIQQVVTTPANLDVQTSHDNSVATTGESQLTIDNPFTVRLEILQQVVLPLASYGDINLSSVTESTPPEIHTRDKSTQPIELTNIPLVDKSLASLSLENPVNIEHKPSYTASTNTSSTIKKKNKKEKRREKEPDEEYQSFLSTQRQFREERQLQSSSTKEISTNNLDQAEGSAIKDVKSCNTCGGLFTSAQYRAHFKSDWHRYNVKLKLKGCTPIDEKEFSLVDADAFFFSQLE